MKETINKTKWPLTEWEKIFANDIFHKGLIFKIRKEVIQLNMKKQASKQTTQLKKWAEDLKYTVF